MLNRGDSPQIEADDDNSIMKTMTLNNFDHGSRQR
jgi:hypothetical protein